MNSVKADESGRVVDFWVANDWLSIALQLGAELRMPGDPAGG
jgi:hypothetical protein